jgi:hypothetical protein
MSRTVIVMITPMHSFPLLKTCPLKQHWPSREVTSKLPFALVSEVLASLAFPVSLT